MDELVAHSPGLLLVEPLGYLDFLCLLGSSRLILTDSGGIQAESSILGVPCLTLRTNTEWPETIQQGTNHLVGVERESILQMLEEVIQESGSQACSPRRLGWQGGRTHRSCDTRLLRSPLNRFMDLFDKRIPRSGVIPRP